MGCKYKAHPLPGSPKRPHPPVSVMISGFHVNTDPLLVCAILAAVCLIRSRHIAWAGVAIGLALSVKLSALIFLPALAIAAGAKRSAAMLSGPFLLVSLLHCSGNYSIFSLVWVRCFSAPRRLLRLGSPLGRSRSFIRKGRKKIVAAATTDSDAPPPSPPPPPFLPPPFLTGAGVSLIYATQL